MVVVWHTGSNPSNVGHVKRAGWNGSISGGGGPSSQSLRSALLASVKQTVIQAGLDKAQPVLEKLVTTVGLEWERSPPCGC